MCLLLFVIFMAEHPTLEGTKQNLPNCCLFLTAPGKSTASDFTSCVWLTGSWLRMEFVSKIQFPQKFDLSHPTVFCFTERNIKLAEGFLQFLFIFLLGTVIFLFCFKRWKISFFLCSSVGSSHLLHPCLSFISIVHSLSNPCIYTERVKPLRPKEVKKPC